MIQKKSILNEFIESVDWSKPLDELKAVVTKPVGQYCKNPMTRVKMIHIVGELDTLEKLQKYTFNALLKFEGDGVVQPIPR